jgi:hypothetical protein
MPRNTYKAVRKYLKHILKPGKINKKSGNSADFTLFPLSYITGKSVAF